MSTPYRDRIAWRISYRRERRTLTWRDRRAYRRFVRGLERGSKMTMNVLVTT
jgi:hypothetical protein